MILNCIVSVFHMMNQIIQICDNISIKICELMLEKSALEITSNSPVLLALLQKLILQNTIFKNMPWFNTG